MDLDQVPSLRQNKAVELNIVNSGDLVKILLPIHGTAILELKWGLGGYALKLHAPTPMLWILHKWATQAAIDNLHISHNASGMGANIRVLLIRNSSSHSSLDVNGLELPCLAATMCFTRLRNQW